MAEPIAIVGSACRFPGSASSPSKLWDLLQAPRDVLRDFPAERLQFSNFYHPDGEYHGHTNVKSKSYLLEEDCRLFDAAFFRINPKEAHAIDPQQRILLETVFESLEAAGWPLDTIEGSPTAVFVGSMTADYNDIVMRDPDTLPTYAATGLARSILANRVSYVFDLRGPSITLDTACSSSLVALQQAVQCLRNGDATQAVVAGATLLLDPSMYIAESKLHMLSPDSRSRMWDKDANGYARGEGCAAVIVKPLSKAIADNDHIECLIREVAVNSDGRTDGLTMPSASAQARLIRQTYAKAGLDVLIDRCQFFECHGTGTSIGDPTEARAIQEAFFPNACSPSESYPLYCGSIKTVVGHLEGCAGLAGILKVSLAIQNRTIPPNLHFNGLNPAIEPYYANLQVPTSSLPWPNTNGNPLRASVNSFGFGGTNAHAILESYDNSQSVAKEVQVAATLEEHVSSAGPFVFSAKTRSSLVGTLEKVHRHVSLNPSLDLGSLAWVLHSRRTAFPIRMAISASSRQELLHSLEKHIRMSEASPDAEIGVRAPVTDSYDRRPKVLGVFTGQGAQWAQMGRRLISRCAMFRESLEQCERALKGLPEAPSWSLLKELASDGLDNRISRAQFSQPLCTAIQIALVDLLDACGVKFDAVIGHSSGEIGAAYASGVLSLRDALAIAYYRGLVAQHAKGAAGQQGGMLAVAMSFDEATAFCSRPGFMSRISVAASNAPSSVTLSGDADAIHEAKTQLDTNKVFARLLKVDTAYHSPHMLCCEEAYKALLRQLSVHVQTPRDGCVWFSSVHEGVNLLEGPLDQLVGQYWVDNMVRPVLFSQAVNCSSLNAGGFAVALEVGPHPALKGPVGLTLKSTSQSSPSYAGCLERDVDDSVSMSKAISLLWTCLGHSFVNLDGWHRAFHEGEPKMLKDLPSYAWDHDQIFWHESRLSHNFRLSMHRTHELLGRLREDYEHEMTWRNVLRLKEIPWLRGHSFQGQVIFPGAGYVSMAVQAAQAFTRGLPIRLAEIRDLEIIKALVIDEDSEGVETLFTLRNSRHNKTTADDQILEVEFVCYGCSDGILMEKSCDGRLLIHLGQPASSANLPPNAVSQIQLLPLNVERFFTTMAGLGIVYDGPFRALRSISRTMGHSKASASWPRGELGDKHTLHPAILDVGFQTGFATFSSVAEKAVGSTYLPAGIKRIMIDPNQNYTEPSGDIGIGIEAYLASSTNNLLEVDINMFDEASKTTGVQIEGLVLKAVAEPLASDDRLLYAKTVWDTDVSCGIPEPTPVEAAADELEYIDGVERTALFFMHKLFRETSTEQISTFKWHHQALFSAIKDFLGPVREGRHPVLKQEWLNDSQDTIAEIAARYPKSVDIGLLTAVGENLPSVMRGESEMLEHMLKDSLLSRLYVEGRGFASCNVYVANFMRSISHKFPRTRILEIGAGTGGTTRSVLDAIDDAYLSYMYTDISAGFFEASTERFADHASKMSFKTLNVEKSPSEQGFEGRSYDVIIAANVLHATRHLAQTMQHARSLLRTGGFLIAVEVTGTMLREPGLMGGLEGWWLGREDGRFPSPGISAKQWHDILQANGFSGIESIIYDMPDISRHNCSVFVTQAVDERLDLLRDPLASTDIISEARVLIVGGQTMPVSKAVQRVQKLLRHYTPDIMFCNSIDALNLSDIIAETSVLCLTELDAPLFSQAMSARRLENLQEMLGNARNVLWVTSGRLADDPYSNMMVGIGRALEFELPHVSMQFLDLDGQSSWDAEIIVVHLLRMILLSSWQYLDRDLLWAPEREVVVTGGQTLVPRVIQDNDANETLNATRRRLTKVVPPADRIELSYDMSQPCFVKSKVRSLPEGSIEIDVELSVALHHGSEKPCFLCFGRLRDTKSPAFAICDTAASVVLMHKDHMFEPPVGSACKAETLFTLRSALVASRVLSYSPEQGTMLVHDAEENVARAILEAAALAGRKILLVGSKQSENKSLECITVHPFARPRTLHALFPADASLVLRFSGVAVDNILLSAPGCASRDFEFGLSSISDPRNLLATAYKSVSAALTPAERLSATSITIAELNDTFGKQLQFHGSTILDWKRTDPLSVTLPPFNAQGLFRSNRTYFMVGLTGELGQSLCKFMIGCGARHIVLASRNPANDTSWLRNMDMQQTRDVDVRTVTMDVTNLSQVRATVSMIRDTMPRIGGLANGALVLEDTLFVNATAGSVQNQLKPKVDGTIHLDEEFAKDELDFFVAFSSLGTVYGNAGQSIYHAANMFMTSMVEKRRRQGKVGSVIDIGMIVDVGYVAKSERAGTMIEEHLRSQFYTPLAETEFHNLFTQAVVSGQPTSGNGNLTMGIQTFIDCSNATARPPWYNNSRFSHMILPPSSPDGSFQPTTSIQNLREKLLQAESVTEATDVVQELFCKKIEAMMKIPEASIDVNAPLSELGLDSLLAVEIRTWLLKDLHFDCPVLKILGRDPMSSICSAAALKLVQECKPTIEDVSIKSRETMLTEPKAPLGTAMVNEGMTVDNSAVFGSRSSQSPFSTRPISTACTTPSSEPIADGESYAKALQENLTSPAAPTFADLDTKADPEEPTVALQHRRIERMSSSQASLYFLHGFLDDPTTFNVTAQYSIHGDLNVDRFTRALKKTLAQHESYQTCFFAGPGDLELKQAVASNLDMDRFMHVRSGTDGDVQSAFRTLVGCEWRLSSGETFKAILVSHAQEDHTLIIGCHHIVMDGMSWHILLQDLDRAYQLVPLDKPELSVVDFSRHQLENLKSGRLDESIEYWVRHLHPIPDMLPLLPFSETRTRRVQRRYGNHNSRRELSTDTIQKIRHASQICSVTPMRFYLTVLQILFARLLDLEDICIGVADSGRGDSALNRTIGHFTNILPMRFGMSKEETFVGLASRTSEVVLSGQNHAQVPLDVILEKLEIPRSATSTPLFQVAFNYRVGDLLHGTLGNCTLDLDRYVDASTPYDWTMNVTQKSCGGGDVHVVEISSNDSVYSSWATEIMMSTFIRLLETLSLNPYMKVCDCKLHDKTQEEETLALGRGPQVEHPWPDSITERFCQVRSAFPESVAIEDDGGCMSYDQLANRANAIATALLRTSDGAPIRVGVLCEPSIDTYAAMLAILRVGAVYVPLDVSIPAARHRAMIQACKLDLLIFHNATAAAVAQCSSGISMEKLNLGKVSTSAPTPASAKHPRGGFLLFSSGSTGTPKGIRLSQRGIMNYAAAKSDMLGLRQVRVLQQSSTGFDMSVAQAVNAFCNGGTLVVASSKARGDPVMISQLMVDKAIEFTICTPSEYVMLTTFAADSLRKCQSWRHACSGGETVVDGLLSELRRLELPNLSLTDCYGPTEISCAATFRRILLSPGGEGAQMTNSVGKAIPNTSVYIVGDDGEMLPPGFSGEICLGGAGVADGYLDPVSSASKFVTNPFAAPEDISQGWSIMYRTGDKGCLREDGSLTFLGRTDGDTLVKLRGLRIELNEIATAILQTARGSLVDAVVTVRGEPEFLTAHVVLAQGRSMNEAELGTLCAELPLPRYMIPSIIVPIDRLPTTPNGKIDRKAVSLLDLPSRGQDDSERDALTVPEGELRLIWRDVLGESAGSAVIRADTDFFTVGGSSLLLVHLQNALKERMGVQMPLHELYSSTTLRRMAAATSKERSQLAPVSIDWAKETLIPLYILKKHLGSPSPEVRVRDRQRQVVLTGAAGFLGSRILEALISDDDVAQIHCIAVPADARKSLPASVKVTQYPGSLLSTTLGLSDKEVEFLRGNVDQIIHAGAQGHCLNNYTSVRQANYLSTQFLASVALSRRIPLHYVSSGRVILQSGASEAAPVSMAAHPPPVDGSEGFTASKWASECFLENVARETGLSVVIHRACSVIGSTAPHNDAMNSVVRYSVLSGTVPAVPNANGFFDFKDVDEVASEITQSPYIKGSVSFRHHSSGVRVPFSELAQRMERIYGGKYKVVSMSAWLQSAKELGIEDLIVSYLEANVAGGGQLTFPYLGVL